jgi:hypothetical protein
MRAHGVASREVASLTRYALHAGVGAQHREEIMKQVFVMEELLALSHALKKIPKNKRDAFLKYKLAQFPFPKEGITLPLEPRMQVKGFVVDKCKALDSFTVRVPFLCAAVIAGSNMTPAPAIRFRCGWCLTTRKTWAIRSPSSIRPAMISDRMPSRSSSSASWTLYALPSQRGMSAPSSLQLSPRRCSCGRMKVSTYGSPPTASWRPARR